MLTWAVEGYFAYQRDGLGMPADVEQAKDDYRTAMNPLQEFIEVCCDVHPDGKVPPKPLFDAYRSWCKRYEKKPLTQQEFVNHMKALGYYKKQDKGWWWIGLGLKQDRDPDPWDWDEDSLEKYRQEGQETDIKSDITNIDFVSLPTRPPSDFIKHDGGNA